MTLSIENYPYVTRLAALSPDATIIVLYEQTEGRMSADYGPPDPPPQWETYTEQKILQFTSDATFAEWAQKNQVDTLSSIKTWRALRVSPINVKFRMELDFE
jgi:hypothetical protein